MVSTAKSISILVLDTCTDFFDIASLLTDLDQVLDELAGVERKSRLY